jgi:hypothetical protein
MRPLTSRPQRTRDRRVATLLTIARLGYAHWFFGNLYEAVVRVPDRLAKADELGLDDRRLATVLSPGSPVGTTSPVSRWSSVPRYLRWFPGGPRETTARGWLPPGWAYFRESRQRCTWCAMSTPNFSPPASPSLQLTGTASCGSGIESTSSGF